MIYRALKSPLLRLLRAPEGMPEMPAGSPDSVEVFRASPAFLRLRVVQLLVSATMVALFEGIPIGSAIALEPEPALVIVGSLVIAVTLLVFLAQYFLVRLDYDMRHYVVTDRSLRIRQGALVIRESTYTFANVQNLSIEQGPLERLFGIANLRIETAGGGAAAQSNQPGGSHHSGVLAGIENAEKVRDRILALLRAYRDAGLGDREDHRSEPAVSGLDRERLREILDEVRQLRAALAAGPDA